MGGSFSHEMRASSFCVLALVCVALVGRIVTPVNAEVDEGAEALKKTHELEMKSNAAEQKQRDEDSKAEEALGVAGMDDGVETDEDTVSEPSYDAKMASRIRAGFPDWDTDKDGKLSREELKKRLEEVEKIRKGMEGEKLKEHAKEAWGNLTGALKADTDGDGTLSLEELSKTRDNLSKKIQAAHAATAKGGQTNMDEEDNFALFTFLHLDWYAPGTSKDDGAKRLPMKTMFEICFGIADANKDGKLNSDELVVLVDPFHFKRDETVKAVTQAQLKLADGDGDGMISFEEYKSTLPPAPAPPKPEDNTDDDEPSGETHEESLRTMFDKVDVSSFDKEGIPKSDGKLDLAEFSSLEYPVHTHDHDLESIFEHDKDNDGKMTVDELVENVIHIGHTLHHEEL